MKVLWHPNILVLHEVIDDPDEDPLILVLEYAAKGQIMEFDSKRMRYRRNLFDATAQRGGAAGPASPAASPPSASGTVAAAASSSSQAKASPTAAHDQPIAESILRKILSDVLNGLEYRQSHQTHRQAESACLFFCLAVTDLRVVSFLASAPGQSTPCRSFTATSSRRISWSVRTRT